MFTYHNNIWFLVERMSISNGKKGGRIVNIASMSGLVEGMR